MPWIEVDPMNEGEGSGGELKVFGGCWVMRFKKGELGCSGGATGDSRLQQSSPTSAHRLAESSGRGLRQ